MGATVVLVVAAITLISACDQGPAPSVATEPEASQALETTDPGTLHAFPDLEAGLPRQIGGIDLDTTSVPGSPDGEGGPEATGRDGTGQLFAKAVRDLGRTSGDLQLAFARPRDGDADVAVVAYRLPGVSGAQLLGMLGPDDVDGAIEPATIAGKEVLALLEIEATSYAYAAGDVVYVVGGSPGLIRAAIQALP